MVVRNSSRKNVDKAKYEKMPKCLKSQFACFKIGILVTLIIIMNLDFFKRPHSHALSQTITHKFLSHKNVTLDVRRRVL